jgi:hypothetical protein
MTKEPDIDPDYDNETQVCPSAPDQVRGGGQALAVWQRGALGGAIGAAGHKLAGGLAPDLAGSLAPSLADWRDPCGRHDGWTVARRVRFLRVLADTASVIQAVRAVDMAPSGAYYLRKREPDFAAAWDAALVRATTELEAVAYERAVNGTVRATWRNGKKTGEIRHYSERLLLALMKAQRPEKYGSDRMVERHQAAVAAEVSEPVPELLRRKLDELRERQVIQKRADHAYDGGGGI